MEKNLLEKLRLGHPISTREQILLTVQLSWPAIIAQLASIAMQYIDAAMVGRLGSNESAAIGLVASTTWLFNDLCIALTTGFNVKVAQSIGAGKNKEARNFMKLALLVCISFSLLCTVAALSIGGALPRWLHADPVIWTDASNYFSIYALFIPMLLLCSLAGGQLRASGNMRLPSALMMLMCLLDVVFNAFLIFPSGTYHIGAFSLPGFGLGVRGAALGTGLAQLAIGAALLIHLLLRSPELHLRKDEKFTFSTLQLKNCLHISSPVMAETVAMASARVVTTAIVAPLGTIAVVANAFGITVESLCYMPAYGMQHAASTLVGQSIGAQRKDLTYRLGWLTSALGMFLLCITGALMYIFAPQMMSILSPDPAVIALGAEVLRIEAFTEPFYAAVIVCSGVFQGAGSALAATLLNFTTMWGIRVPLSALLAPHFGLHGVWFAMALQLGICGLLYLLRLWRKRWLPKDFLI